MVRMEVLYGDDSHDCLGGRLRVSEHGDRVQNG